MSDRCDGIWLTADSSNPSEDVENPCGNTVKLTRTVRDSDGMIREINLCLPHEQEFDNQ